MLEPEYIVAVFQSALRTASIEADRMGRPNSALPTALIATAGIIAAERRREFDFRMSGWKAG